MDEKEPLKIINLAFITVSLKVIMELKKLDYAMTVCKVASESDIELNKVFYFIGRTNEEYSKSIIRLLSLEEV